MNRGLFITFEGPDGAGKTTQIKRLTAKFTALGRTVLITREPGGTVIGEKIRELLLDPAHREMDPVTEALLYAASRAQHVAQVIEPALMRGETVICDRFIDSSIAYQAYGRGLGEELVRAINAPAIRGMMPDVTFCIWASPALSKQRLSRKQNLDRLEDEKTAFFERVADAYRQMAQAEPERIVLIPAGEDREPICAAVDEKIEAILHLAP